MLHCMSLEPLLRPCSQLTSNFGQRATEGRLHIPAGETCWVQTVLCLSLNRSNARDFSEYPTGRDRDEKTRQFWWQNEGSREKIWKAWWDGLVSIAHEIRSLVPICWAGIVSKTNLGIITIGNNSFTTRVRHFRFMVMHVVLSWTLVNWGITIWPALSAASVAHMEHYFRIRLFALVISKVIIPRRQSLSSLV